MSRSTLFTVFASLLAAGLMLASGVAQARETKVDMAGPWKIIAVDENGKLNRCLMQFDSPSGMLRIAHFPKGDWNLSFPGEGVKPNTQVGASFNGLSAPNIIYTIDRPGAKGARAVAALAPNWLAEMRKNGTLRLKVGNANPSWVYANSAQAMDKVKACVKTYK